MFVTIFFYLSAFAFIFTKTKQSITKKILLCKSIFYFKFIYLKHIAYECIKKLSTKYEIKMELNEEAKTIWNNKDPKRKFCIILTECPTKLKSAIEDEISIECGKKIIKYHETDALPGLAKLFETKSDLIRHEMNKLEKECRVSIDYELVKNLERIKTIKERHQEDESDSQSLENIQNKFSTGTFTKFFSFFYDLFYCLVNYNFE
jgi:hypothetical protein